jgi:hypothetical protein
MPEPQAPYEHTIPAPVLCPRCRTTMRHRMVEDRRRRHGPGAALVYAISLTFCPGCNYVLGTTTRKETAP